MKYRGITIIHGCQCSRIVKILLVRENVMSWVPGLLHYNARQFITLFNVREDVNSWVRVTLEIYEY